VSVSFVPSDGSPTLSLLTNGEPEQVDEERAKKILEREDLEILVQLGMGNEKATYWTCDFSHVRISLLVSYAGTFDAFSGICDYQRRLSKLSVIRKARYRMVYMDGRLVRKLSCAMNIDMSEISPATFLAIPALFTYLTLIRCYLGTPQIR
jgi:hypothetical protein